MNFGDARRADLRPLGKSQQPEFFANPVRIYPNATKDVHYFVKRIGIKRGRANPVPIPPRSFVLRT
jgi:hypothetical protein